MFPEVHVKIVNYQKKKIELERAIQRFAKLEIFL